VSLNVADVGAAVGFYGDLLGLPVREDRTDFGFGGAWLDAGPQQIHLIEGPVPTAVGQHLALQVDDLDGVVAELRARGVGVSEPLPVGGGRQAFLSDPSGNLIELHQAS
jgi:glyoxylase I family protein